MVKIGKPDGNHETKQPRRGRGVTKTYPVSPFETVATLADGIARYSVSGEIQRLTLMDKLGLRPGSSKTRDLIIGGNRYGLTKGSYQASSLSLTEAGKKLFGGDTDDITKRRLRFELAIAKIEPFAAVYAQIKERSLPDSDVLNDEFADAGVAKVDAPRAVAVFVANLRHIGLIQDITGTESVRDIEAAIEDTVPPSGSKGEPATRIGETAKLPQPPPEEQRRRIVAPEPSVHIDIQIHIDSSATAEQIDQTFASMARHLYGK